MNGDERNAYKSFVEKSNGKRPLGKPRHRCVDNIKVGFMEIVWGGIN
jgi:hypothetical protein